MKRQRGKGVGAAPAVETQPASAAVSPSEVRVRFVRAQRHDGVDRIAGEELAVCTAAADWLVALSVAVRVEA